MRPPPLATVALLLLPVLFNTATVTAVPELPHLPPRGVSPQRTNNDNTTTPLDSHVVGRPNFHLPDPCGPPRGQPGNAGSGSRSTCDAQASAGRPVNDPFRLQCQLDDTGFTMNWDSCRLAVGAACTLLTQATNPTGDAWVWAPVFTSTTTPALNCSMGFWLPRGGALAPDPQRCRDGIIRRMIDACEPINANVVSVNLKRLPRRTRTERFTGEAWDPGYPSYLIVAQNWVPGAAT